MTHIQRLRAQAHPVQEDTPTPPRAFTARVDRRDLQKLLDDYDAVSKRVLALESAYCWNKP